MRELAYGLLHSPSVGPATWEPVAAHLRASGRRAAIPDLRPVATAEAPFSQRVLERARDGLAALPVDVPLVLCAHSNAGLFLPLVAMHLGREIAAVIFVDASVPPDAGEAEMIPPGLLEELKARSIDGWLPRWTDWWPEPDVAALFPNDEVRRRVVDEQPQLPIAYYEEKVPVPLGWDRIPAGYLLFGPPYDALAEAARRRGWPVSHVAGEHLHMVVEPERVAGAITELAGVLVDRPVRVRR